MAIYNINDCFDGHPFVSVFRNVKIVINGTNAVENIPSDIRIILTTAQNNVAAKKHFITRYYHVAQMIVYNLMALVNMDIDLFQLKSSHFCTLLLHKLYIEQK